VRFGDHTLERQLELRDVDALALIRLRRRDALAIPIEVCTLQLTELCHFVCLLAHPRDLYFERANTLTRFEEASLILKALFADSEAHARNMKIDR
jgi:hypothetical protein